MDGKKVVFRKVIVDDIGRYKFYVQLVCLVKGIKLSNTQVLVLVNFIMRGYNKFIKEEKVSEGIVKNSSIMANMLSDFRKVGIIEKNGGNEVLSKEFDFEFGKDLNVFQVILKNE